MLWDNKGRFWAAFLIGLALPWNSDADSSNTPEAIRAQYVVKTRHFVKVGNPLRDVQTICHYEKTGIPPEESVGQLVEKLLREETGSGSAMPSVKTFHAIRDLKGCDIFFIPADEEANIDNILTALGASETLTISAAKRFIYRGGMIGFVMDENNRVKMEANLKNIQKNNVKVSPDVLEIMTRVINQ